MKATLRSSSGTTSMCISTSSVTKARVVAEIAAAVPHSYAPECRFVEYSSNYFSGQR